MIFVKFQGNTSIMTEIPLDFVKSPKNAKDAKAKYLHQTESNDPRTY